MCVYVEELAAKSHHPQVGGLGWVGLRCHRCSFCAHLFEVGSEGRGGEVWEFVGFADGKLSGVGVEFGRQTRDEKRRGRVSF